MSRDGVHADRAVCRKTPISQHSAYEAVFLQISAHHSVKLAGSHSLNGTCTNITKEWKEAPHTIAKPFQFRP